MLMSRRSFIAGTTLLVAAPAVANLLSPSPIAGSLPWPIRGPAAPQTPVGAADTNELVFKVDGWSVGDDLYAADGRVLISINQSWRCGWR
jgi:hypothetical protein